MSKKNETTDKVKTDALGQNLEQEDELSLDDLDQVSGGSLRNVVKERTTDISKSTMNKI